MKTPSERARATAREHRGAWVYELDPTVAEPDGEVPPHLIVGAWRSDARGEIVGDFRPNPEYRPAGAIPDDASEILDEAAGPAPLDVAGESILTPAEEGIRRGMMGLAPVSDVLATLWRSNGIILSGTVTTGSMAELQPLYVPKGEIRMLAMFTHGERVPPEAGEAAPYALSIPVSALFPTLGPLIGVVVNPGSRLGLEISPEGVAEAIAANAAD
ncbi:SseB family protein [Labedella phragmitis]|uniref:SseB family protein n=1 Tax=Labedella phragmitis TaxID=2498849 RepID=A0A444PXV6_9MICO|nr:SseB family protein [Labedella phragmitis]RWZ52716.1 SseB family protein [Labedella phragmitis]